MSDRSGQGARRTLLVAVPVGLLLIAVLVAGLVVVHSSGSSGSATALVSVPVGDVPQVGGTAPAAAVTSPAAATATAAPKPSPKAAKPRTTELGVARGTVTVPAAGPSGSGEYVLFVVTGAKGFTVKDATAPFALRLNTRTLPNGTYKVSAYAVLKGHRTLVSSTELTVRNAVPKPKPKSAPKPAPGTGSSGTSSPATGMTAQENEVIALTNADRAKAGCGPVKQNAALTRAAVKHAGYELKNQAEGHLFPGELSLGDRFTAAGYTGWRSIGENAAGAPGGAWWVNAEAVMHGGKATKTVNGVPTTYTSLGWMQDAAHKANILNCGFTDIGVGAVKDSHGAIWWSQDFGTRS